MPRRPRIQFEGALYHVTTRGNNQKLIYLDDRDRELFLSLVTDTVRKRGWLCHSFCLMGNHYHLLIETPGADLADGMWWLNGQYARAFNARHGRKGHLFERRYNPVLVLRDAHLLEVCRYVVLNPVRAGLCETADEWKWSSFHATAGVAPPPPFLEIEWVLEQFGRDIGKARDNYVAFIAEGSPASALRGLLDLFSPAQPESADATDCAA